MPGWTLSMGTHQASSKSTKGNKAADPCFHTEWEGLPPAILKMTLGIVNRDVSGKMQRQAGVDAGL